MRVCALLLCVQYLAGISAWMMTEPSVWNETPVTTITVAKTTASKPEPLSPPKKTLLEMTLGEILLAASKDKAVNGDSKPSAKPTVASSSTTKRGCFVNTKWYQPLSEIERGQSGSWCFGTYCNYESEIIHWDDHNCTSSTPAPAGLASGSDTQLFQDLVHIAKPTTPTPKSPASLNSALDPATMNQLFNQFVAAGAPISGDLGALMPGSHSTGGGGADLAAMAANDPSVLSMLQETMASNHGGAIGGHEIGAPGGSSGAGCFYEGRWYAPGTDISNNREYGHCYGTYCDFQSKIIHWSDRCAQTMAPPTQSYQNMQRQLEQLDLLKK